MPFIRLKNKRQKLDLLYISNLFSQAYQTVYEENAFKYREEISFIATKTLQQLQETLGDDDSAEVSFETFLNEVISLIPKERIFISNFFKESLSDIQGKKKSNKDIFWSVKLPLKKQAFANAVSLNNKTTNSLQKTNETFLHIQVSQEQWLAFFEEQSKVFFKNSQYKFFFSYLKAELKKYRKSSVKTDVQWFDFFYSFCLSEKLQKKEPRAIYFAQFLKIRKTLSDLIGVSWLLGSGFNETGEKINKHLYKSSLIPTKHPLFSFSPDLDFSNLSNKLFSSIWKEFVSKVHCGEFVARFNLDELADLLLVKNEFNVSWLGYHNLFKETIFNKFSEITFSSNSNAVIDLVGKEQGDNEIYWQSLPELSLKTNNDAIEPIQFVFMNLAMNLSARSKEPTSFAKSVFLGLVNLYLVFPTSLIKLLHRYDKEYKDWQGVKELFSQKIATSHFDYVHQLSDTFESIYQTISDSVIGTKWVSQATLNFSHIRKSGSSIRNGLRISNGIEPYINLLNELIKSQGREQGNFPICTTISLSHFDVLSLLNADDLSKGEWLLSDTLKDNKKQKKKEREDAILLEELKRLSEGEKEWEMLFKDKENIFDVDFRSLDSLIEKEDGESVTQQRAETEFSTEVGRLLQFPEQQSKWEESADITLLSEGVSIKQEELLISAESLSSEKELKNNRDYLQRVILVPDEFLKRVLSKEEERWYVLDPHFFKKIGVDIFSTEGYQQAEKLIVDKRIDKDYYKEYLAKPLFLKLVKKTRTHNLHLVFEKTVKQLLYPFLEREDLLLTGFLGQGSFVLKEQGSANGLKRNSHIPTAQIGFSFLSALSEVDNSKVLDLNQIEEILLTGLKSVLMLNSLLPELQFQFLPLGVEELAFKKLSAKNINNIASLHSEMLLIYLQIFKIIESLKKNNNYDFLKKFYYNSQASTELVELNKFIDEFNQSKGVQEVISKFQSKFSQDFKFDNMLLNGFWGLNNNEQLSSLANCKSSCFGIKNPIVTVIENGVEFKVHSCSFLKFLEERTVHFEIIQKSFLKFVPRYYSRYEWLFKEFVLNLSYFQNQTNLFNYLLPFFKQGVSVYLPKSGNRVYNETTGLENYILHCWQKGFSKISFV